jgi:hypothetical protein
VGQALEHPNDLQQTTSKQKTRRAHGQSGLLNTTALAEFVLRPQAESQIGAEITIRCETLFVNDQFRHQSQLQPTVDNFSYRW